MLKQVILKKMGDTQLTFHRVLYQEITKIKFFKIKETQSANSL